jgi:UDP-N-acetylmuramoyl-L-alanyl-D-glutamate--2,6-diaminopimelate ligase
MEVSSHSLVQKRVKGIPFSAGIFTNLGRDHLDYHKTPENYRNAKSLLFQGLEKNCKAIFNAEDPASNFLQQQCQAEPFFHSTSSSPHAKIFAQNIHFAGLNTSFTAVTPQGEIAISLSFPGIYNVSNALAALTCALSLGISLENIQKGLSKKIIVPGRMEPVNCGQPFTVLIDYAHTPEALKAALLSLRYGRRNRLLLVFGCGGERDQGKRAIMGSIANQYADYTWITSDNPRRESSQQIANQIASGFSSDNYCIILSREIAISNAIRSAKANDTVLIAGKGHETYQIMGEERRYFSDKKIAEKYLNG